MASFCLPPLAAAQAPIDADIPAPVLEAPISVPPDPTVPSVAAPVLTPPETPGRPVGATLSFHPSLTVFEEYTDNFRLTRDVSQENFRTGVAPGASVLATYRAVAAVPRLPQALGANLVERSMFGVLTFYLPAFLMLRFAMSATAVAPFLGAIAAGMIAGNVLGGWLGDRVSRPGTFVAAQLATAALGLLLFGAWLPLPVAIAVGALVALVNAVSRRIRGGDVFGQGDVKLMAAGGIILGVERSIVAMVLISCAFVLLERLMRSDDERRGDFPSAAIIVPVILGVWLIV